MRATQVKRAFSLVEILVVLAIIALLASIIFAVASSARKSGYTAEALSNLGQIGRATALYLSDNDSKYPVACSADDKFTVCSHEQKTDLPSIQDILNIYIKAKEVWRDRADTGIPALSPAQYSEPIECQLPGTSPSMFSKYGSSFVYRKDLGIDQVSDPFEFVTEGSLQVLDQSETAIIYDGYANWHGGPDTPSKRVCALFGDGHTRLLSFVEIHQQGAFQSKK